MAADPSAPDDAARDLGSAATEVSGNTGSTSGEVAPPAEVRGFRTVEPGVTLDRYVIEEELGTGGMATVYRARDQELRREVAVKVLFPHLAKKREVVRRFSREARAAAGLEHAHILRVYDVGGGELAGGDPPYIVMELVRGGASLKELAETGALPAELVASIGAVVCDALAVAHARGVVHRDVKPGNVLVAPGGRLLLADFGVARIDDDDSVVTRTGALLGTPSFMSPEQAQGMEVDARSDLYSVGASLYQLATASLPFAGPTARVVAQIVKGELTPPLRRAPAIGPDLARAIEQLMAVEPARRPASAVAAAAMLRAVAAAGGVDDVDAELARFFADPDAYRAARPAEIARVVVAKARAAIARRELARAIALADRATALAPDDPDVRALTIDVSRGGRRRAWVAALGACAIVGGGGASIAMLWPAGGRAPSSTPDAPPLLLDAAEIGPARDGGRAIVADAPGGPLPLPDAVLAALDAPTSIDAALAPEAPPVDAHTAPPMRIDAAPRPRLVDAGLPSPLDASPPDAGVAPPDAPTRVVPARLTIETDAWCNLTIDGAPHGRPPQTIELAPGHHDVVCSQGPGLGTWREPVELAAGDARTLTGTLLSKVRVTLDIDASIDGVPHKRGEVVELAPTRHHVDGRGWFSVPHDTPCHLRDAPELDCYP